jgi:hypothetical protein
LVVGSIRLYAGWAVAAVGEAACADMVVGDKLKTVSTKQKMAITETLT